MGSPLQINVFTGGLELKGISRGRHMENNVDAQAQIQFAHSPYTSFDFDLNFDFDDAPSLAVRGNTMAYVGQAPMLPPSLNFTLRRCNRPLTNRVPTTRGSPLQLNCFHWGAAAETCVRREFVTSSNTNEMRMELM